MLNVVLRQCGSGLLCCIFFVSGVYGDTPNMQTVGKSNTVNNSSKTDNKMLLKEAASGDAKALAALRKIPDAELILLLKSNLDNFKDFSTMELLRIGSDEAMAAVSGETPNKAFSKDKILSNNWPPITLYETVEAIKFHLQKKPFQGNLKEQGEIYEDLEKLKKRISGKYKTNKNHASEVHAISVYKGKEDNAKGLGPKSPGKISVNITYTDRPIILFLSAYKSVAWKVLIAKGVKLKKVFINGYYDQSITGIPEDVPIEKEIYKISNKSNAIMGDLGKERTPRVERVLNRYLGQPVASYMGADQADNFIIGPESVDWRESHTLSDARNLLHKLSGKSLFPPLSPDLNKILNHLDNNENMQKVLQKLSEMKTPEARSLLLRWSKEAVDNSDEDNYDFLFAFGVLQHISEPPIYEFLMSLQDESWVNESKIKSKDIKKQSLEAIKNMAEKGYPPALDAMLAFSHGVIEDAKNDTTKAYEYLHWLNKLPESKKNEVDSILKFASESTIKEINSEAERLLKKRNK